MKKSNKFFTKLSTVVVSLAMALGVGVAAASNGGLRAARATVGNDVSIGGNTYTSLYETGFEGFNAGTTYNSTQTYNSSVNERSGWIMYYGTVSTNDKIAGNNSAQMRWYSSAKTNYPYIKTTTSFNNVKAISFKYSVSNTNVDFLVQYNTDGGDSWTDIEKVNTDDTEDKDYEKVFANPISSFYFRILVTNGTAPSSGNYKLIIDSVVFASEKVVQENYTVSYDGAGATSGDVPTDPIKYNLDGSGTCTVESEGNLKKTNYKFDGWTDGANNYLPGETFNVTSDVVLFAVWVIDIDHEGTAEDPYSVKDARTAIAVNGTMEDKYTRGIIYDVVSYNQTYKSITYWISDDGTGDKGNKDGLQVYGGLNIEGQDDFASKNDLQVGDNVVVKGTLKLYSGTYEYDSNNRLISLSRAGLYAVNTSGISNGSAVGPVVVAENDPLELTISANEHYSRPTSLVVTMGGEALSAGTGYSYNVETGVFGIANVTGDVVITGSCIEDPKYTVTYLPGEGSGDPFVSDPQYAGEYTLATFASTGLTKPDNKTFKSWLVNEVEKQPNETIEITNANITVTALYKDIETFKLFTGLLTEGDYVLTYDGVAINTTIDSNRLKFASVTPEDNKLVDPDPSIVWHIGKSGDNWTIYNAEALGYLSGRTSKNTAELVDDTSNNHALWELDYDSEHGTYDFINVGRSGDSDTPANKYLRKNGSYGFACYGNGTGGAFTLYKLPNPKLDSVTSAGHKLEFTKGETFSYGGTLTAHYTDWKDDATVAPTSIRWDSESGAEIDLNAALSIEDDNNRDVYVVYTEGGVTKSISYKITVQYADVTSLKLYRHDNSQEVEIGFDLPVGQKLQLDAVLNDNTDPNTQVLWRTSDNSKAIVDEGLVTSVAAGDANITAFVDANDNHELDGGEVSKTVSVHINENPAFSLNKKTIEKYTGTNELVELVGTASNFNGCDSIEFEWTTSNASVANVSQDENYKHKGNVTFGVAGEATITCTAKGLKAGVVQITLSDHCDVTVLQSKVNSVTINAPAAEGELYLGTAETQIQLSAEVDKDGSASPNVNWSSSNTSVATVVGGLVAAQGAGTATITAASADDQNIKDTYEVTVYEPDSIKVTAPTKVDYELGEEFDSTGFSVKAVFGTDENKVEKDAVGYGEPNPDMTKVGKQTVEISLRGKTDSFEITIVKKDFYAKLTNISDLKSGDQIVIAVSGKDVAMGDIDNKVCSPVGAEIDEQRGLLKTTEIDAIALTVVKYGDGWVLKNSEGQYLACTKVKELSWSEEPFKVSISVEDGNAVILFGKDGEKDIRIIYNCTSGTTPRFSAYSSNTSASMLLPQIYVIHAEKELPDEMDNLRANAIAELEKYATNKGESNYSKDNWAVIQGYVNSAKDTINACTKVADINDAVTATKASIDKVKTAEQEARDALAKAIEDAEKELKEYYDALDLSQYTETGKQSLKTAYINGVAGIKASQTLDMVATALADAKAALDAVEKSELVGIEITHLPDKVTYEIGEEANYINLEVTATYSDQSKQKLFYTDVTIEGFDTTTAGEKTITVKYGDKSATFTITVNEAAEATLLGIDIATEEVKTTYNVGDTFDATGLVVTAKYSDGSSEAVTNYTLSQVDMSTAGTKTITVTYEGKTATFTITVNDSTQPSEDLAGAKTAAINTLHDYMQGLLNSGEYDTTGRQQLGQEYDKGIVLINSATTIAEVNTALTNAKALLDAVAKQGGGDTPAATLESIAVTTNPTTTTYTVGDEFKPDGLVVTATYSDGSTKVVTGYTLSTVDMSTAGTKTITVTYNGKTATFTITVNEAATDPLEEAKANAITELETFVNALNRADYSDEAWQQIQNALAEARTAINAATDATVLNNLVAQVKATINAVKDNLELAKAAALQALEQYYNSFDKNNYDDAGVAALTKAYNDGKDAIEAATTTDGVAAALANAKAELDAVKTKSSAPAVKRCGGDIAATSIILSTLALAGVGLLVFKKRKQD